MSAFKIVLQGAAAAEYMRLRDMAARLDTIESTIMLLNTTVNRAITRQEELVSDAATQLNAKLDELAQQITDAKTTIVNTVTAETQEDVEQNQRLAEKQAALDAANVEIQQLRDQLAGGVSPAEAAAISDRIAELSGQVVALSAASVVTDPGTPTG